MECGVMPKEKINFPAVVTKTSFPEGDTAPQEFNPLETSVSVTWSDDEIQIEFEIDRWELLNYLNGMDKDSPEHVVLWYTPPLSRADTNKMIRALRRARDKVFGKDE